VRHLGETIGSNQDRGLDAVDDAAQILAYVQTIAYISRGDRNANARGTRKAAIIVGSHLQGLPVRTVIRIGVVSRVLHYLRSHVKALQRSCRVADSLGLRRFLGIALTEATPDQSTLSRTRRLIYLETREQVFACVLTLRADRGLLQGKRIGIDATTLEANAAMKSIVRRDAGESYNEFLTRLVKASGIETATREDLARLDRKR